MLNVVDYKRLEQLFSSLSSQQNFNIDVGEKETGITSTVESLAQVTWSSNNAHVST